MKAAVFEKPATSRPFKDSKPLKIQEIDLDPPGRNELLVRVLATGLCHSDLSVIDGERPRPGPMVLGHEATGEVVEVGKDVNDLKPGDQVAMVFVPSCGCCLPCAEGRPALCEPGAKTNLAGTLLSGDRRLKRAGAWVNHHVGADFLSGPLFSPESLIRMRIAREEIFGPVLSVIPFDDDEEAIEIANDSPFGLGAGVWTTDVRRMMKNSEQIEAGTVWINTYRAVTFLSPFGGFKRSGLGRESGQEAIREFLQTKSVWISYATEEPNPFVMR
jgi:Aldehyde dehydrogenase family/Alcohol dehydrogenase GroES-like domain